MCWLVCHMGIIFFSMGVQGRGETLEERLNMNMYKKYGSKAQIAGCSQVFVTVAEYKWCYTRVEEDTLLVYKACIRRDGYTWRRLLLFLLVTRRWYNRNTLHGVLNQSHYIKISFQWVQTIHKQQFIVAALEKLFQSLFQCFRISFFSKFDNFLLYFCNFFVFGNDLLRGNDNYSFWCSNHLPWRSNYFLQWGRN